MPYFGQLDNNNLYQLLARGSALSFLGGSATSVAFEPKFHFVAPHQTEKALDGHALVVRNEMAASQPPSVPFVFRSPGSCKRSRGNEAFA